MLFAWEDYMSDNQKLTANLLIITKFGTTMVYHVPEFVGLRSIIKKILSFEPNDHEMKRLAEGGLVKIDGYEYGMLGDDLIIKLRYLPDHVIEYTI